MLFIHKTVSLCDHCYRHIPANVYEKDDKIMMTKLCPDHGEMTSIVEVDKEFYYSLTHHTDIGSFNQILFEASDRCQLTCPHCYHLPDNKITDKPIEQIIDQLKTFPANCAPMLAGAEATLRPDFIELCDEINKLNFERFEVLTNGLRFADQEFTESCKVAGLREICFGLNHPSYQGEKVHAKQLKALDEILKADFEVGYVGYTLQSLDEVDFILEEIQKIKHKNIHHYRIRCGSFIGRSSDQKRSYLSDLVKYVSNIIGEELTPMQWDDNPYHVMLEWNDVKLRLIQWPDVTNIDLEELATGPWCHFTEGPVTNFVHQVIIRDAVKNMNMNVLDFAPKKYHYRSIKDTPLKYWKEDWQGPVKVDSFDWALDPDMTPKNKNFIAINQI